jgi:hypothetical protein
VLRVAIYARMCTDKQSRSALAFVQAAAAAVALYTHFSSI